MPIILPDFKKTHCVSITACADITPADRVLKRWLQNEEDTISIFKTALGKTCLRVMYGGRSGNHIHIDLGQSSFFTSASIPKANRTIAQVQKKIDFLMGKAVDVDLRGLFEIPIDELPANGLVRTLFFETKTTNVGIKMIGARFAVSGGPVGRISWQMKSKTEVGIVFESHTLKTSISEDYLTKALGILESAFNAFILGRT
jgi:hypothetical protein